MTANLRINPTVKEINYMSRVSFCSEPSKTNVAVMRKQKHRIPEPWQFTDKRFRHETTDNTSLPLMGFFSGNLLNSKWKPFICGP